MAVSCIGNYRNCYLGVEYCFDNSQCIPKRWVIFTSLFLASLTCLMLAAVNRLMADSWTKWNKSLVILSALLSLAMLITLIVVSVVDSTLWRRHFKDCRLPHIDTLLIARRRDFHWKFLICLNFLTKCDCTILFVNITVAKNFICRAQEKFLVLIYSCYPPTYRTMISWNKSYQKQILVGIRLGPVRRLSL